MLLIPSTTELSCGADELPRSPGLVVGRVYYSNDSLAKIYEGTNWSCINITAYCIEEYKSGIVDLAIDKGGSIDQGSAYPNESYDEFKFDPAQWKNENTSEEHIAVGENEINGSCYVFITSFFYNNTPMGIRGLCKSTEWEHIPTPTIYAKGSAWVNISIPKFKNPQKNKYNNTTPNINNTIGFTLYRSKINNSWTLSRDYLKVGETTYSDDGYYYFNDTNLSLMTTYYYAVAPIARGGYITYHKSHGIEISTMPLVTINAPNGGEVWSGNTSHIVSYTIHTGEPPYVVDLSYSVDSMNWTRLNTTIHDKLGTYTYNWATPKIDSKTVRIRIDVTDSKSVADFDTSNDTFEIDSTPPTVKNTLPGNGSSCSPSTTLAIEFDEAVNKTSAEAAFSYTDGIKTWTCDNGTISWAENIMMFTPYVEFEMGMHYNCTISTDAKDASEPGNTMIKSYTWGFVAAPGWGNFSVDINYPPSPVGAGEICQIKVTITNALDAENRSGGLIVKFLESANGKDFISIDTKTVSEMFPGNSTMVCVNFSLTEGIWYLKVNFTSTNPDDIIEGHSRYYETAVYKVEVVLPEQIPKEEKGVGPWPYVLIAFIVVIAIVIGSWIIASHRKEIKKKRF